LLNQLLRTVEQYKKSKNIQTNWIESIKYKANKLIEYEKQREEIGLNQNYVQNLKNSFDSNAVRLIFIHMFYFKSLLFKRNFVENWAYKNLKLKI
jgi:hypothetical protein